MFKFGFLTLIFYYILYVQCNEEIKNFGNTESVQCKDICTDNSIILPITVDAESICQRGCRFFSLIYAQDESDLKSAKEKCYSSCAEAYDLFANAKEACRIGCIAMLKQKENDLASMLVFLEQDSSNSFVLMKNEREFFESDLNSGPLIKAQAEYGYDLNYKIPETRIRTMPIAAIIEERLLESREAPNSWLDCASKNSGIPKWILLFAILTAVLVALWLCIATEKREAREDGLRVSSCREGDSDDVDLIDKKDVNLFCDSQDEVNFSVPVKCSTETKKV